VSKEEQRERRERKKERNKERRKDRKKKEQMNKSEIKKVGDFNEVSISKNARRNGVMERKISWSLLQGRSTSHNNAHSTAEKKRREKIGGRDMRGRERRTTLVSFCSLISISLH